MSELENTNTSSPSNGTSENAVTAASTSPASIGTQNAVTTQPVAASPTIQAPIIKASPSKGRKLSPIKLAVGCILFFMLFIGLTMAAGYAGIKNPKALGGIMSAADAKNLLLIVSGAFFGILFLVSFAFMGLNGYRLSKAKNTPKLKLIIGLILSLFALTTSLAVGAVVITSIQKIDAEIVYSKDLIIAKISVIASGENKEFKEIAMEGIMTIAPVQVYFEQSKSLDGVLRARLGLNNGIDYKLSCGNGENRQPGQIVPIVLGSEIDATNAGYRFPEPCFYTKKGVYKASIIYKYFDKVSQQNKEDTIEVATINVPAEMILKNDGALLKTNDAKNELIAGDNPARIIFDAKKIFSDVNLKENLIIWNFDGENDDINKENKSFFSHTFSEGKLYTVYYRLPGSTFPRYYYSFPIRTLQSDVPLCSLNSNRNTDGSYSFEGSRPAGGSDIENLKFEIYNINQERVIQTTPVQNPVLNYTFPDNQQYIARLVYNTLEKKKGFCESEIINAASEVYNAKISLQWKWAEATTYTSFASSGSEIKMVGNEITASQTPFDIQLRLDSITPKLPQGATVSVQLNKQNMKAESANLFTARVYGPKQQELELFIDDKKGNTVQKNWTIKFNQDSLVGQLKADKVTGIDPLTVGFDASAISATKDDDEVIYYSWDFGDGDVKKNVTQSKINHTYLFNTTTEVGTYSPSVVIQTKKGETKKFTLDTPISVKRKTTQVTITSPSHQTQVASEGDTVEFNMQTDGYVTAITWDFGDGSETYSCEGRACAQTKHTYGSGGTYSIRATVEYKGLPSSTSTLKIKVQ